MQKVDRIKCVMLGGGGHAAVIIDALRAGELAGMHAILDSNAALWGRHLMGVPILGSDELLPEMVAQGVTHFAIGKGAAGDNRPRERLYRLGCSHRLKPLTVIHPGACCSDQAAVGAGAQLLPGSIVNTGAALGCNVIVNSGAVVEHDCVVGDHAHIASGAVLASTVRVGELAHVGAGATIVQLVSIGDGAVVGAGAVVTRDVPANAVVAGVPARIIRTKSQSL